jgi:hypothetical protein
MATFASVAAQLNDLVKSNKYVAMDRATLHVLSIAMREVRVKTGTLRRSHARKVEAGGNRGIVGTNLKYARPLHEGYGPHVIRPKTAKALYWKGARHPVKRVRHPGWRGDPWLRRTATKGRSGVERELQRVFGGALVRIK